MTELVAAERLAALAHRPELVVEADIVISRRLPADFVALLDGCIDSLLRVRVMGAADPDNADFPDISGDREVLAGEVRFVPHLPFDPGVRYRAILDLGALGQPGLTQVVIHDFLLPKRTPAAEPEVSQIFPSADPLPENLLRFHVRFSNPMQRGRAADHIELLGPDGRPAPDGLYRAPVELWDRSMIWLTILLDPGRLKRGVGPNRTLGPPLKRAERYTLVVGRGMIDIHGRPLRQAHRKSFTVSEPVREPLAIDSWRIAPPIAGSREPLVITFPAPLDYAQLRRGIIVASERDERIGGRVNITKGETQWQFIPDAPWRAGLHSVSVSPCLEDICGNTPYAAFDGPLRSAREMALETAVRSISFEVRPT
jgi:hypothetical protein